MSTLLCIPRKRQQTSQFSVQCIMHSKHSALRSAVNCCDEMPLKFKLVHAIQCKPTAFSKRTNHTVRMLVCDYEHVI
jgi:hypothetical protein